MRTDWVDPYAAGLDLVRHLPFGTVLTAHGRGRRFLGPQRVMRTSGRYHFRNQSGLPLYAFDLDLTLVRDVVIPGRRVLHSGRAERPGTPRRPRRPVGDPASRELGTAAADAVRHGVHRRRQRTASSRLAAADAHRRAASLHQPGRRRPVRLHPEPRHGPRRRRPVDAQARSAAAERSPRRRCLLRLPPVHPRENMGFRFLHAAGLANPLAVYEDAFAGTEGMPEIFARRDETLAVPFPDPDGRTDRAGRVIPHEFVVLAPDHAISGMQTLHVGHCGMRSGNRTRRLRSNRHRRPSTYSGESGWFGRADTIRGARADLAF